MLNINLKIEAKKGYIINDKLFFFLDMSRSKELKLIYQVFEETFLIKYQVRKLSKRSRRNTEFKSYMSKRQNELSLKISKLSQSKMYIDNKISILEYPFPDEEVSEKKKLLKNQSEKINELIILFQDEIRSIYFK